MGGRLGKEEVVWQDPSSSSQSTSLNEGCRFHNHQSAVWERNLNAAARLNPPAETLPLPFKYYGQAFYKGYEFEKKV